LLPASYRRRLPVVKFNGDNHLLKLKEYQGIKIIKAKEMLGILEGGKEK